MLEMHKKMQYAAAAGSNDVDVMKLMRDVLSTQET